MASKTILLYGDSGVYKSTQLGLIADVVFQTTGRISRLISADSGWGPMADQIRRGVIVPLDLNTAKQRIGVLSHLSKGYWPDGLTAQGEIDEATLRLTTPEEWEHVGCYLVEGLYMIGSLIQRHLESIQQSTGEPLAGLFSEMNTKFSQSSRGTYGFVQSQTENYVRGIKSLPVNWAVFTTHEARGEDDRSQMYFGPAVVGKALTDKVSGWFENTFHLQSCIYAGDIQGVQAYYERHRLDNPGFQNLWWTAKTGLEPALLARVKQRWPGGTIPLLMDQATGGYQQGIGDYVQMIMEMEKEVGMVKEVAAE